MSDSISRRWLPLVCWLICLPAWSLIASNATPGAVSANETVQWIEQLGNDSYEVRCQAALQLAALGLKARDALSAGLHAADPEVRRRCRRILDEVLEADHQQRLKALLADDGHEQHDLPGWTRYRRIVGGDRPARELFVRMQRAESGLLASAAAGDPPAARALDLRLQQIRYLLSHPDPTHRKPPSLGTIAAMVFVGSDPQLNLPRELIGNGYWSSMIRQASFQQALKEDASKPAARKLLGQWIRRPADANLLSSKLVLAMQYDIKDGLHLALKALGDAEKMAPNLCACGLMAVGKLGGKPYAAAIAPLLGDERQCARFTRNKQQITIEIRDVALAMLVRLTDQDHAAYGQEQAKKWFEMIDKAPAHAFNFSNFGFADAAKREAALKKWKTWVAAHPLPELPPADEEDLPEQSVQPAPPAAGAGAVANAKPGTEPPEKPQDPGLPMADRPQTRGLAQARRLLHEGHYAEATRFLGNVLAARADYVFQPDKEVPLFRHLKPEAEGLIGRLPAEGLAVYRMQFEPRARQTLDEAIASGDVGATADVAQRFFHTRAGAEATYLLGTHCWHEGRPFGAALYFQRLRDRAREADRFEPSLSVHLAACWLRAGLPETAVKVLLELKAGRHAGKVEIAGRQTKLFAEDDQALTWLESLVGPQPDPGARDDWPMFRGGPARNVSTGAAAPFLQAKPLAPMAGDPLVHESIERIEKQHLDERRAALPCLHPLVVGDTLLLRTATGLRAVDPATGELRWEAPLDDSLRHLIRHADEEQKKGQAEFVARGLLHRLWEDTRFGTLSSDGRYVFGVEGLGFRLGADYQRAVVMPDGTRQLDCAWLENDNLLVAYEIRSGKLKWEIGGPADGSGPQAGTYFLGPPLPIGETLYVLAEVRSQIRLLVLDARTGRLKWQRTLALHEEGPSISMWAGLPPQFFGSSSHSGGMSPSYADGILVCPAPQNRVIALDLTTRDVLWIYQTPVQESSLGPNLRNLLQRKLYEAGKGAPTDRWVDATATIAGGRVLLTPEDSGKLFCLNLADGRLMWSAPRADGLYVGGVEDGRVVVVGRGSVRAFDLDDGTPAWPNAELPLPDGAFPSGRGYLGDHRYYLPLNTAEVAAVDLEHGRLVARSRSPDRIVPGNLVSCRGTVVSQSVEGAWSFQPLAARDRQLAATLRERPDDPEALADRGEVLLYEGQIAEAIDHLRRAIQLEPAPRTRQLLGHALIEALRVDFDGFRELAAQLDPLIEDPRQRFLFFRQLALSFQQTGRSREAFEAYLKLIELDTEPHELQAVEAARMVRGDRWIQARLAELHAAAPQPERAAMDRQITARLGDDRLEAFLRYFGQHPAASEARLSLAHQLSDRKQWLEAERLFRRVLRSPDAAQEHAAIVHLAALLRAAGRPEEAAPFYRHLAGPLAEVVCLDGKTGRQLVDALPADAPVRGRLEPARPWPTGRVRTEIAKQSNSITTRYPVRIAGADTPFDRDACFRIETNGQTLAGCDGLGRQRWQVALEAPKNRVYSGNLYSYAQGRAAGHLLALWLGDRVCAVDVLGNEARVLWTRQIITSGLQHPMVAWMLLPWMRMPRQPTALPGSTAIPLAATEDYACFQQERRLLALDPLSGETLWLRDDVAENSDLFGDDELLFVTPGGADEARVLSVLTGKEVGRRRVPALKQRITTLGRRVLTWATDPQKAQLTLVDPWTDQVVWQREFGPKAQPWLVAGNEVGVLDPEGRLEILALPGGNLLLSAQVDPVPGLESMLLLRSETGYVLVANRPPEPDNLPRVTPPPGNLPVNGLLYGFDRQTGTRLWSTQVANQVLNLDQPRDLPVLIFLKQFHKKENNALRTFYSLLCLDKRNGRILHEETSANYNNIYELHSDPENHQVEVRIRQSTIKLTFTGEPLEEDGSSKP